MPVLTSEVDTSSAEYLRNREAQIAAVAALTEQLELVAAGGGERYAKRHHDRGKLLARERIELLIDRDAPFMELSALAAWGTEFNVGAAIVTGVGVVLVLEAMKMEHTVRAPVDGIVASIQVSAGDQVASAQVLAVVHYEHRT